jgi:hypothetical protein
MHSKVSYIIQIKTSNMDPIKDDEDSNDFDFDILNGNDNQ